MCHSLTVSNRQEPSSHSFPRTRFLYACPSARRRPAMYRARPAAKASARAALSTGCSCTCRCRGPSLALLKRARSASSMASTPALGATGSMPASSGPASSTAASWRPPNPASRPSTELPKIKVSGRSSGSSGLCRRSRRRRKLTALWIGTVTGPAAAVLWGCGRSSDGVESLRDVGYERREGIQLRYVPSPSRLSIARHGQAFWTCTDGTGSPVMRTITFNLRSSPLVKEALGEGIRPRPFLAGEPWVHGKVSLTI